MNRPLKYRLSTPSLLLVAATLPALLSAANETPATAPAQKTADARTADGIATIRRIAADKLLRLSTDIEPPPKRFQFAIRLSCEPPNAAPNYTDYLVVKDGDRTGVLIRDLDGLPYCYITEGLMVMVDREVPGRLLVTSVGAPSVVYRMADEPGKLDLWISHIRKATKGTIDLNIGPILLALAEKVRQVTYERSSGTLVARTDQSAVMLTMRAVERPGDFGLRGFVTRTSGAQTIALLDPEVDNAPALDLTRINKQSIAALELPIREIADDEKNAVALTIPAHFGADPKERAAATKLASLLSRQTSGAAVPR